VIIPTHVESGRTYLSKGLVNKAAVLINENIQLLSAVVTTQTPLIGIEPSAILTYRDEAVDLATEANKQKAAALATSCFTIEEFIASEAKAGLIDHHVFTTETKSLLIHGHCYQKSLSSQSFTQACMEIPVNYKATLIPSGCCGMAGGFGYEEEHYAISQQVGELVLFPAVRAKAVDEIVVAAGTSCRHQIKDGTHVKALHPVEVLYEALVKK